MPPLKKNIPETKSFSTGKTLDEAGERDFKIMCLLCGKTTAQDVPAPADDNNSFPDLPF